MAIPILVPSLILCPAPTVKTRSPVDASYVAAETSSYFRLDTPTFSEIVLAAVAAIEIAVS